MPYRTFPLQRIDSARQTWLRLHREQTRRTWLDRQQTRDGRTRQIADASPSFQLLHGTAPRIVHRSAAILACRMTLVPASWCMVAVLCHRMNRSAAGVQHHYITSFDRLWRHEWPFPSDPWKRSRTKRRGTSRPRHSFSRSVRTSSRYTPAFRLALLIALQ